MQLLKFENYNCQPCKEVSNYLDNRGISYLSINAFDKPDIAGKFKVRTLPTLILLDDYDVEQGRATGFKPIEIDKLLKTIENEKN